MINFLSSKNKIISILCIITVIGAIFRFYGFFDLIFFEIDQARDYKLISDILEKGLADFPLLGPKAGGTFFRLGPIYYLPSLLASYIFDASLYVAVVVEAIISVATIPLFFFLLREFFSQKISLYLIAIFSTSLFFVEYAHFSWNPNPVPFFFILLLYAILKYSQITSNKTLWIAILATAMGILSQLHVITLVGAPLVMLIYFIILKKTIPLKHLAVAIGILLILLSPMIMNDVLTRGENLKELTKAFISREEKNNNATLGKLIFKDIYNFTRYYSIIITSHNQVDELVRVESSNGLRDLLNKNIITTSHKINLIKGAIFFLIFAGGFILMIYNFLHIRKNKKETNNQRRYNFLLLLLITQIVFGVILLPLSLKADSRYFLPVAIIPFVILGFFGVWIEKFFSWGNRGAIIFFIGLFMFNIWGTMGWLEMVKNYSLMQDKSEEFILEPYFIVTAKQWSQVTDKIIELSANHDGNLYVQSTPYHIRPLLHLLEMDKKRPARVMDMKNLDSNGMYFFLRESDDFTAGRMLPKSIEKRMNIVDEYTFGTVILMQLEIKKNQETEAHETFTFMIDPVLPRCYELNYHIEAREKCTMGDIIYLFKK